MTQPERLPAPPERDPPAAETNRILTSEEILQGEREVLIRHGAEVYRLRLTRQGKLILQK